MRFLHELTIGFIFCLICAVITSQFISEDSIASESLTKNYTKADIDFHKYCILNEQKDCSQLNPICFDCRFNYSCVYGDILNTTCKVKNLPEGSGCSGQTDFSVTYHCAFCYQLDPSLYTCIKNTSCKINSSFKTQCTAQEDIICLGNRTFEKYITCTFTSGYKWSTALILSITLGGFGIDRFYLGSWAEGIGKLFSFGGLGVWTLIDVILIAAGYLKPADGSVYI